MTRPTNNLKRMIDYYLRRYPRGVGPSYPRKAATAHAVNDILGGFESPADALEYARDGGTWFTALGYEFSAKEIVFAVEYRKAHPEGAA